MFVMKPSTSLLLALSALSGVSTASTNCEKRTSSSAATETIDVDVAIIGGGATGAYAAVRLRDDYQKKVLVIEKANRLVSLLFCLFHLSESSFGDLGN